MQRVASEHRSSVAGFAAEILGVVNASAVRAGMALGSEEVVVARHMRSWYAAAEHGVVAHDIHSVVAVRTVHMSALVVAAAAGEPSSSSILQGHLQLAAAVDAAVAAVVLAVVEAGSAPVDRPMASSEGA